LASTPPIQYSPVSTGRSTADSNVRSPLKTRVM
jgi:hypothetical protein